MGTADGWSNEARRTSPGASAGDSAAGAIPRWRETIAKKHTHNSPAGGGPERQLPHVDDHDDDERWVRGREKPAGDFLTSLTFP
ncbi:MAG: hypothetical protein JWO82_2182 [Akkermansiaceae bacterium]|nr:hypothetical protein [Akkermansiaceae bacterium]